MVLRNQNIQSGDFVQVRSEIYQVIGYSQAFPQNALELQIAVDIKFEKPDKNKYGTVSIGYKNACFNILGFLTHDIAV